MKIVICGGPLTGKTTLASEFPDLPVFHTDDWQDHCWKHVPDRILEYLQKRPEYVLEGVQAARCLRAGLKPDRVIWLSKPRQTLTERQLAMSKGILKVFREWREQNPNVKVEYR